MSEVSAVNENSERVKHELADALFEARLLIDILKSGTSRLNFLKDKIRTLTEVEKRSDNT